MKRNSRKPIRVPWIPVLTIAGVVLVILLILGLQGCQKEASRQQVQEGLDYLASLEQAHPAAVDQVRREIYQRKLDAQREALLQQLTGGELDPFSLFQDFVILGDSRAVGYYYFGFFDESRVLAGGGDTIRNIEMNMDAILSLNPSLIFLCYGLNDTSIGYWETKEDYVAEYMQILDDLQAKLPNATIVVSSILPAREPAFQLSSKWHNIPEWSAAVGAACAEKGYLFADNDEISRAYSDLWDPDGIHVKEAFYPYWASNLIATTLTGGESLED